jgi:hypothetical protein
MRSMEIYILENKLKEISYYIRLIDNKYYLC